MTIRLAKISRDKLPTSMGPSDFYIGRTFNGWLGSPLGNPYSARDYGRLEAVNLYRIWLRGQVQGESADFNPRVITALKNIRDKAQGGDITLWCWCAPNLCHGEVILEAIESWEF